MNPTLVSLKEQANGTVDKQASFSFFLRPVQSSSEISQMSVLEPGTRLLEEWQLVSDR